MTGLETLLLQLAAVTIVALAGIGAIVAAALWQHVVRPARCYGICRTVYLLGPWAIKVPRLRGHQGKRLWSWTRGVQANLSEADWSGVQGVAPVLRSWLGGIVNVYPRYNPWPFDFEEPPYDQIGEGWLPRDRKPANIGVHPVTGEAAWLDYDGSWNGCPHDRNAAGLALDNDDS